MRPTFIPRSFFGGSWVALGVVTFACLSTTVLRGATPTATGAPAAAIKSFTTPQQAADALIDAAERFDVGALSELFGPAIDDIILSGEPAQGRVQGLRGGDVDRGVRERAGLGAVQHLAVDLR